MTEVDGKVFIHVGGGLSRASNLIPDGYLQATDYADTTFGVPFVNEATLVVELAQNEGELKVKHVKEFLDSRFTVEFLEAVRASRKS